MTLRKILLSASIVFIIRNIKLAAALTPVATVMSVQTTLCIE